MAIPSSLIQVMGAGSVVFAKVGALQVKRGLAVRGLVSFAALCLNLRKQRIFRMDISERVDRDLLNIRWASQNKPELF